MLLQQAVAATQVVRGFQPVQRYRDQLAPSHVYSIMRGVETLPAILQLQMSLCGLGQHTGTGKVMWAVSSEQQRTDLLEGCHLLLEQAHILLQVLHTHLSLAGSLVGLGQLLVSSRLPLSQAQ